MLYMPVGSVACSLARSAQFSRFAAMKSSMALSNEKRRRSAAYWRVRETRLFLRRSLGRLDLRRFRRLALGRGMHLRLEPLGADVRGLGNARRLAAPAAQIIELGTPHLAAPYHLDLFDHRREDREDALHPLAVRNLADREALLQTAALAGDDHALIGL